MSTSFEALILREVDKNISAEVENLTVTDLPIHGDVRVQVSFSSLNYKDALAVTGKGKIVRGAFPFVAGIDLAGQVVESENGRFRPGDWIVGTGGGLGETCWGGYSGIQNVASDWLVPLPENLSARQAMIVGTAGLTAMLSIIQMERLGQSPEMGPVVVSGATGGVGSFAVLLLSRLGYAVTASTGKKKAEPYLRSLGASSVIDRSVLGAGARRGLDSAQWGGAIDTVGGSTLEAIASQIGRHGSIAVCGLVGDARLHTTVYPLILRGISILGVDSNTCPVDVREQAWSRLADLATGEILEEIVETIPLNRIPERSIELLNGQLSGRTLVEVSKLQ